MINNLKSTSNPISLVNIKPSTDPSTTNTNIQVKSSINNVNSSFSDTSNDDLEIDINHEYDRNPRNSQSSTKSIINSNIPQHITSMDGEISSNSSPVASSHSKISELANKVTDYLFSTRRSIDFNHNNLTTHEQLLGSKGSATSSPIPSRESSHVSLTSLARAGKRTSKRRTLFCQNMSPSRDASNLSNNHNYTTTSTLKESASNTSLSSTANLSSNNESQNSKISRVKETHYVHVEYDPVTRKRILNTYEILKDLGSGQHGKVKLAKDIATGKNVAIKIVDRTGKPALLLNRITRGKGQTQEDKIRKEIAIMKKCDHPHVVKLIEVLDAENSRKIYLVLEYLEKGEVKWQISPEEILAKLQTNSNDISGNIILEDLTPEPLLKLKETKKIFRDVLSGLDYLHHQGIIHRDIKPSNLLVSKDHEVKISDFGVSFAANLDGEIQDDFELAKTAGTPAFLAPELCSTQGSQIKVTNKIDIWSLGVTLYCLVFGCLPFYAESEFQLFESINHQEVKFPDITRWRVAEQINEKDLTIVKDLIIKLLDKNPDTRIDIDQIVQHPFVGNEFSRWNQNMKIDVSNEEVDDAVVGLGNRIRKKISDAFKRKKSDSNKINPARMLNAPFHSLPLNLKDDCSYILSEERNKNSSRVSLSLLDDSSKMSLNQSRPTTALFVENIQYETPSSDESQDNHLTNTTNEEIPSLSTDCTLGVEPETPLDASSPNNDISSDGVEVTSEGDKVAGYDYRKDLNDAEKFESVQLTVNPSFASLDSFYDDSYSKFLNPMSGVGSYSSRNMSLNSRPPVRVISTSARNSPNLMAANSSEAMPIQDDVHRRESKESISMIRKISNSPSTNTAFALSNINQANINFSRGLPVKVKTSPIQSSASISTVNHRSPITMRNNGRQVAASNPMINNSTMKKSSEAPRRAIFINHSVDNSSDEDCSDGETNKPVEFKKKSVSAYTWSNKVNDSSIDPNNIRKISSDPANSKPSFRKAVFTSGGDDEDDDDQDNDGARNSIMKSFAQTSKVGGSVTSSNNLTKSSIYGTKLNLMKHSYKSDSDNDNDDDSEEELFLSFGKNKEKTNKTDHKYQGFEFARPENSKKDCDHAMNICNDDNTSMVDVPTSIIEAQIRSAEDFEKNNKKIIMNDLLDDIKVLDINDDDLYERR